MIHNSSDMELNENIYVTPTDYTNMSLEREKQGIILENPFEFDIQELYNEEYLLAAKAAEIINEYYERYRLSMIITENGLGAYDILTNGKMIITELTT